MTLKLTKKNMWKYLIGTSIILAALLSTVTKASAASCVMVSGEQGENYEQDISISRRIVTPTRRFGIADTPRQITCKITEDDPKVMDFSWGIPDNSILEKVKISVYLDGELAKTVTVMRGQVKNIYLDLNNVDSYAIEYKRLQGGYDFVYAVQSRK